ncbi:Golgi apparatus membrane protein tvp18 [Umbelopsis sp. WA50703]
MSILNEFASRNFSLYGQWLGLASLVCLVVLGVFSLGSNPVFAILGWVFAFILVFVEVPLCMKFCPTSPRFDSFATRFENSYLRTLLYLVMAIVMFLSATISKTLLLLPACLLLFAAISYGIAAIKGQPHASSTALGGTGVDNVV